MEANRKRVQVHRLPTKDKSKIFMVGTDIIYSALNEKGKDRVHLYFTTDEEIKEGDWMMNLNGDTIYQHFGNGGDFEQWNKIIASTDPKLTVKYDNGVRDFGWETKSISYKKLPQPSQALIKAYCEQGGSEVDVEYEINPILDLEILDGKTRVKEIIFIPKVDPIHNTITTYRIVEKMYSRDEVLFLLHDLCTHLQPTTQSHDLTEWIKENL